MKIVFTGLPLVWEKSGKFKVREKSGKFRVLKKVREIGCWSGKFRGFGRYFIHADDAMLIGGAVI